MEEVVEWLTTMKLQKYADLLEDNDYISLAFIKSLKPNQVTEMIEAVNMDQTSAAKIRQNLYPSSNDHEFEEWCSRHIYADVLTSAFYGQSRGIIENMERKKVVDILCANFTPIAESLYDEIFPPKLDDSLEAFFDQNKIPSSTKEKFGRFTLDDFFKMSKEELQQIAGKGAGYKLNNLIKKHGEPEEESPYRLDLGIGSDEEENNPYQLNIEDDKSREERMAVREMKAWLSGMGLENYAKKFEKSNYTSLGDIKKLKPSEVNQMLDKIGMKPGSAVKIHQSLKVMAEKKKFTDEGGIYLVKRTSL